VVRSYFGLGEGAEEEWTLVASLYFRKERWVVFPGEDKVEETEEEKRDTRWMPWERVYSREVLHNRGAWGREGRARQWMPMHTQTPVRLPGRIL
jgi:hypothetical protein